MVETILASLAVKVAFGNSHTLLMLLHLYRKECLSYQAMSAELKTLYFLVFFSRQKAEVFKSYFSSILRKQSDVSTFYSDNDALFIKKIGY